MFVSKYKLENQQQSGGTNVVYHSFRPGQVWLDTEGKRIHAHGGSVIQADRYHSDGGSHPGAIYHGAGKFQAAADERR